MSSVSVADVVLLLLFAPLLPFGTRLTFQLLARLKFFSLVFSPSSEQFIIQA